MNINLFPVMYVFEHQRGVCVSIVYCFRMSAGTWVGQADRQKLLAADVCGVIAWMDELMNEFIIYKCSQQQVCRFVWMPVKLLHIYRQLFLFLFCFLAFLYLAFSILLLCFFFSGSQQSFVVVIHSKIDKLVLTGN